MLIKKIWH